MIIYPHVVGQKLHPKRQGLPTASSFSKIINFRGQVSSQFEDYARQVAGLTAEKDIHTEDMANGVAYEPNAIYALEQHRQVSIDTTVGFITDDNGIVGCSPDGMLLDDFSLNPNMGIEVKSPKTGTHKKYKKDNKLPNIYYPQVMGSMAICGFDWVFASYDKDTDDLFDIHVKRDEEWIKKFWQLIQVFNQRVIELKRER
jgi:hypothetical protein